MFAIPTPARMLAASLAALAMLSQATAEPLAARATAQERKRPKRPKRQKRQKLQKLLFFSSARFSCRRNRTFPIQDSTLRH